MRTLVISDLHLGTHRRADVLTRAAARDVLIERLDGVQRLVLLGDTLELRHGPARDALARAEPVMRAIGDALGPAGEVVIVPGNHDHALAAGWLDSRGRRQAPDRLVLDERVPAERASWIAERLGQFLAPARVDVAYPGLWLRDDVYAMHGHYLDAHVVIPTIERLAVGVMARLVGAVPDAATTDDYEALLAPLYALNQASAERAAPGRAAVSSHSAARTWRALAARRGASRLRGYALALPFRLGVLVANRAGIGPVQAQIGVHDLRTSGLAAIAEVARRLRLAPAHLVFGHTHRAGRLAQDDADEWRTPAGTQLHNAGNWIFESVFVERQRSSPYWPGGAIVVDEHGPPRLERLLQDVPASALLAAG
ncbi:MAG: metallophosphoesterase [Actinomycetota bacterium]|nr:metallophosphoesterase [Actinomycetota bacterium]